MCETRLDIETAGVSQDCLRQTRTYSSPISIHKLNFSVTWMVLLFRFPNLVSRVVLIGSTYSTCYFSTTQLCKLTRPKPSHGYAMLNNLALTTHECHSWSCSDCVHQNLGCVKVIANVWFLSQRLRFSTPWGNTGIWELEGLISLSSVFTSPPTPVSQSDTTQLL